jgi:hypothetical protein
MADDFDDYIDNLDLVDLAKKHSENPIELSIQDMSYRPKEADRLVAQTKKSINNHA